MATAAPNLEWAKNYVAGLNDHQLTMLKQMYEQHRASEAAKQQQKAAEEVKEKERAQQQEILDLLTSQKPITVDVLRSSTSPESFTSSCEPADTDITVKDLLLGKIHSSFRATSPRQDVKPYKPRGSRERVLFDEYLFVFDKLSYDCKKRFFRCERKNSCPARVHTPIDSDRVIHKAQIHNHPPPQPYELANYDINFDKVRHGFVVHVNPIQHRAVIPPSILTPTSEKSDVEEENLIPKLDLPALLNIIKEEPMEAGSSGSQDKKPVTLCIPDNFHKSSDIEARQMEVAITRFLIQQTELRKELLARNGDLPTIFPPSSKDKLTLFVADASDDVFHMIEVKERTEPSIREALQAHLKQESPRTLHINISSKINIPLQQQMIDEWKTEEFLRLDSSKPNGWKITRVTKVE